MYFPPFKRLLLKLSIFPCALASLALAVCLIIATFHYNKSSTYENYRNLAAIAAEISASYLNKELNARELEGVMNSLVQHKGIKSVRLISSDKTVLRQLGQRQLNSQPVDNWYSDRAQTFADSDSDLYRISHPILSGNEGRLIGWVELGFSNEKHRLSSISTVALILVLCIAWPLIAALFALDRVNRLRPGLEEIESGITAVRQGDLKHVIQLPSNSILKPIGQDLNELSAAVRLAQAQLKRNLEQSIDELRETMETIEIQNIELDLARKRAIEASKVKSEFLANASHEFRTPLNGIIGFTQLLLKADNSETQQEFLRTIEHSAQGLLTIINDILDISHIEEGTLNLDHIPIQLEAVLNESLKILGPTAFKNEKELIALIDPSLPLDLVSDPMRIKQILTNLVNSAINFSSQTNISIAITKDDSGLVKPKSPKSLIFKFEIGGLSKDIDRDFESAVTAFSNLETGTTDRATNTDLGLAISQGLIKALGGTMGFDTLNESASIWFSLPIEQGKKSKRPRENATAGLSVVLCCENLTLKQQLMQVIAPWKLRVTEIADPQKILLNAESISRAGKYQQLLIMDVPVVESKTTSTSFLDQLTYQLNHQYHCKSLFICSPEKQRQLIEAQLNRAVAFSSKPVNRDHLYKTICKHLNIYKQVYSQQHNRFSDIQSVKPKALAVDDNPANLLLVRELLTNLGAIVVTVASGSEAINECKKQKFDIVFMDIQMPGIDGIQATKEIRNLDIEDRRTPIVALTAHAVNDRKSELLLAGLDDYLSKPVTEEQLAHVIRRWCQLTRQVTTATSLPVPSDPTPPPMPAIKEISATPSSKLVDLSECIALAGNKPHLAKEMLQMLLKSLPANQLAIDQAIRDNDMQTLEEVVHKLRGGAKCTGAKLLAQHASELDQLLFNKSYRDIYPKVSSVTDAIDELIEWEKEHDLEVLFDD